MALRTTAQLGIGGRGEPHWAVIDYLPENFLTKATPPLEEDICRQLDLVEDCMQRPYEGPIEVWKMAGLPDPGAGANTYMHDP